MENYDQWKLDTPENYEILNFTCISCDELQDLSDAVDPELTICNDCFNEFDDSEDDDE